MKHYGRLLALILVLTMFAGMLAGCGQPQAPSSQAGGSGFNATGFPIVDETITLTCMTVEYNSNGAFPYEDHKFFPRMEELTNIHLDITWIPTAAVQERLNLSLTSGDYPDIILKMNVSPSMEMIYGDQEKIFISLENLIKDYAPNLNAELDNVKELRKQTTLPSGHIYSVPFKGEGGSNAHPHINTYWLKNMGLEMPKSLEEFYQALKAIKEKDPNGNGKNDEIPISLIGVGGSSDVGVRNFLSYFGLVADYSNGLSAKGGNIFFAYSQPQYYDLLEFFAKLYKEELLDPETFTHTQQEVQAKAQDPDNSVIGVSIGASAGSVVGGYPVLGNVTVDGNSYRFYEYESLIPWETEYEKAVYPGVRPTKGTYLITDKCKYPEAAIRWVDYLFTEEGRELGWMGVEGEEYTINPDGTWQWIPDPDTGLLYVRGKGGLLGSASLPCSPPAKWALRIDVAANWTDKNRNAVRIYDTLSIPALYVDSDSQRQASGIWADIEPYTADFMTKIITGQIDLNSEWQNYLDTLKKMGIDDYITIYQKIYEMYLRD